jgi:hypothetical protein
MRIPLHLAHYHDAGVAGADNEDAFYGRTCGRPVATMHFREHPDRHSHAANDGHREKPVDEEHRSWETLAHSKVDQYRDCHDGRDDHRGCG